MPRITVYRTNMISAPAQRVKTWHLALVLASLCVAAYGPFLGHPLLKVDDDYLITGNPAVQGLTWRNLRHIFTTYDPELYIPLTFFSYQLNHAIAGLNPFVFHGTNLALHIANVLLVVWIVSLLLHGRKGINGTEGTEVSEGKRNVGNVGNVGNLGHLGNLPIPLLWGRAHVWALFVGLLFALHPVQTEAVLWASARKDVLSGFFVLLSIVFYLLYRHKRSQVLRLPSAFAAQSGPRSKALLYASLFTFLLALLAKVSAVTLPFLLLLLDWWEGRKIGGEAFREKIAFFLLSLLFLLIALGGKAHLASATPIQELLALGAKGFWYTVAKIFWPARLSIFVPQFEGVSLRDPLILLPIIGTVLFLGILLFLFRRKDCRIYAFGFAWFTLLLAPSLTNFWKSGFLLFASDRYAYLPSVGIFLIVAWLASLLSRRRKVSDVSGVSEVTEGKRNVGNIGNVGNLGYLLGCAAITALLLGLSWRQGATWRSTESLYRQVYRVYPDFAMARSDLGMEYMKQGRVKEAKEEFRNAIALAPWHSVAYFNLAAEEGKAGNVEEAIRLYRRIIDVLGRRELTSSRELERFFWLTSKFESLGLMDDALRLSEKLSDLVPMSGEVHAHLAFAYDRRERRDDALREWREAVARGSKDPKVFAALGAVAAQKGEWEEATVMFQRVLALDPANAEAKAYLAEIGRRE